MYLVLTQKSDYTDHNPRAAGLYHIAYVHPTRSALANRLAQVLSRYPELYEGSANHLVSEAFYMHDPE
jgi:catechol 2,3-dioxygenase